MKKDWPNPERKVVRAWPIADEICCPETTSKRENGRWCDPLQLETRAIQTSDKYEWWVLIGIQIVMSGTKRRKTD